MVDTDRPMSLTDSLRILREIRRDDEVIITSMGTAREWMTLSEGQSRHPLDFILVPSSMGHATSLGLGLAMARPDLRVVVCSGDGSLLMNLGTLVSITAAAPGNLVVLVFDNGVYEVTGSQPTPAAPAARVGGEGVDFLGVARSCGFRSVKKYEDVASWRSDARQILDAPGPAFVLLDVMAIPGGPAPHAPREGTAADRGRRFMESVAAVAPRALFSVRRALPSDATDIEVLVGKYVASGSLLPRTESFIAENATDFIVAVEGDRIVGCGHLDHYAPSLAELRSLAVDPERQGIGIGRAIAAAVEELARKREYKTLFAVSNDEAFFLRLGFVGRDIPELDKERSAVSKFKGVYAKTLD